MKTESNFWGWDWELLPVLTNAPLYVLAGILIVHILKIAIRRNEFVRKVSWIPGPPALPIFGNTLNLTGGQEEFHRLLVSCREKYGPIFRLWIGTRIFVFLTSAEDVQPILSSMQHIDKSYEYSFLKDWLGQGLITSTGTTWQKKRKMLTPSFHSNILEDFGEMIGHQIDILLETLHSHSVTMESFDVVPYLKLCALDIICVTAMGKEVGAQQKHNGEYVTAVEEISAVAQRRFITPWIKPDLLFKMSSWGRKQAEALAVIKGFVGGVIAARKEEKNNTKGRPVPGHENNNDGQYGSYKSRKAFLDLLLDANDSGAYFTDQDIEDEVNTFMFAGHDTTASAVSWCLYVFGKHAAVQERIVEEYKREIQPDESIYKQLKNLQYLDLCIKEVLRMYPIAPLIARDIRQPVHLTGGLLPEGTTALIHSTTLHRDPKYFKDPHKFCPERFEDQIQPFTYIPFSAGPRNCIGQRFAQMSTKIIVARILERYQITSVDAEEMLQLAPDIVLKNKDGINLKLMPRHNV